MTEVAVIGMGTMGPGIAATLARGGLTVRCQDTSAAALDGAPAALAAAQETLEALGMPDRGGGEILVTGELETAVAGAALVVETIPEDLELKRALLARLDGLVAGDCVLASDTSGIPVSRLQDGTCNPGRVIGMHWSNPPHIIPIVEVIAGVATASEVSDWMAELIRSIGLIPIVVRKDVPGFVENRVLYALLRECLDLVENEVIDPQELDACVSWGIGYKLAVVGPMALLDMAGLDIYQAVGSYLNRELSSRADVSAEITGRTARGRLGIKSGEGIYSYAAEEIPSLRRERARRLIKVRKALEG